MRTEPPPSSGAPARLRIHAERPAGGPATALESALHRLRRRYASGRATPQRPPLALQVDDLQGRRLLAIEDAGALTDLPLAAGTYQVGVTLDGRRRSYTLTLEAGAAFDLHLQLAPDAP
jgi:hypothetical protein